jgi:hypothetical protein
MSAIAFSLRGDREVRQLIDSLSGRELQNRTRRATRAGAAVMRTDLRARVRGGRYPKSFRKIATRSSTHGGIKTQVGPTSPLHNIFEGGAEQHTIAPKHSPILHSQQGEPLFVAAGPVKHPGMAARPLTTPAFEATKDQAAAKAMDKLLEGLR